MGSKGEEIKKHLLTGISYMIPLIVAAGICIALGQILGGTNVGEKTGTIPYMINQIGGWGMGMIVPVICAAIAYSIADRPGLAPGMVGGMIANTMGAGFLGGIIAGFLAGYIVLAIKKYIKLPKNLQGIMPVLIIPVLGVISTGLILFYIVGTPVAAINAAMNNFLANMQGTNAVILGIVLGAMMAFDMGGPVNKAAYTFATGTLTAAAGAGSTVMAAVMAAGMVPPLGLALATVLFKDKFTPAEKEAGKAAWVLGISFITEGAIPFAAADPLRVIPSIMLGSAVTGALSMLMGCTLSVPHGGIFVTFAVTNILGYVIALAAGTAVTAFAIGFLKKSE